MVPNAPMNAEIWLRDWSNRYARTRKAALLLLSLATLWSASVLGTEGKWREASIMIRIFAAAALVATTATVSVSQEVAPYLDDRSTAERVVSSLYNAIDRQEYLRACADVPMHQ